VIGAYLGRDGEPARDAVTVSRVIEQELFDADPTGKGNA
jgi:hypothetical protein